MLYYNEICYNEISGNIDSRVGLKNQKSILKRLYIICCLYNLVVWRNKNVLEKEKVDCCRRIYIRKEVFKRIEQENLLKDWKIKLEKVSIPALETELYALEKRMNQYSLMEFDSDIQKITDLIEKLPDRERLLFNYEMGYKFSKSKQEFSEYFSEGLFKNYPEMGYVETNNSVGLSFTASTECLLYCAVYGDQITQIPLNKEHPYYYKLKSARIEHREMIFNEYCSNILLTGKNISLKDPYVLKDIIKISSNRAICALVQPLSFTNSECENLGQVYRKIGFDETADFYFDIKRGLIKGR